MACIRITVTGVQRHVMFSKLNFVNTHYNEVFELQLSPPVVYRRGIKKVLRFSLPRILRGEYWRNCRGFFYRTTHPSPCGRKSAYGVMKHTVYCFGCHAKVTDFVVIKGYPRCSTNCRRTKEVQCHSARKKVGS